FLKFETFNNFSRFCVMKPNDALMNCIGNWWSLVRSNAGPHVLRAPVTIYLNDNYEVCMTLKGNEKVFQGILKMEGPCLVGNLDSGAGKLLSVIFKLGSRKEMTLIKGVFCGLSSAGEPIAGREILMREKFKPF